MKTVLYVEDDQDDRELFEKVFKELYPDHTCVFAESGLNALLMISSLRPQPVAIYLDLNMPGLNGLQLLAALKADTHFVSTPIYLLSTSRRHKDAHQARMLGATGYLTKPSTYQEYIYLLKSSFAPNL